MYTDFGARVDAAVDPTRPGEPPQIDARDHLGAVEVLEGAIAAARRAGVDPQAVELAIWGAGIEAEAFHYASLDGAAVTFRVVGGKSVCATGGIPDNLTNYNASNADEDARDLYKRLQTFTAARPGKQITFVSHSWGGVVAEYFAQNLASYIVDHGPLGADAAFAIAAGVPGFVPGFTPHGTGFYTIDSRDGDVRGAVKTYEINRPDDPAHSFDPAGNGGGHHYIIRFGAEYRGWYGITTDDLSCGDVPGICPKRS
jgi:pimeloyl-ACP methyl ester carboxylesterase